MLVCAHGCVCAKGVCERQEQRQEEMNRNEKLFFFLEGKSQKLHLFKNILPLSQINIVTWVRVSLSETFKTNLERMT